eukprot:m.7908 g.7908  ORF g.7908 m.7908 type:complete len:204 (-) comp5300_c1_seq1:47-658(-)
MSEASTDTAAAAATVPTDSTDTPAAVGVEGDAAQLTNPLPQKVEPAVAKLHLKIASAFKVFDSEDNGQVDVRELGTVVRSLGLCPSEAELHDIIMECEEEEPTGYIKYERFEPVISRLIADEKRFKSESVDTLMTAFKTILKEVDGASDPDVFARLLMDKGEPFTQDEIDELMSGVTRGAQQVNFEEHAILLSLDEEAYPFSN